jgi:galactokinase
VQGCAEFAGSKGLAVPEGDILLMVSSSIPPAAGLSSSSALVVATAMVLLELWGIAASPHEVAEFTCRWGCADLGPPK